MSLAPPMHLAADFPLAVSRPWTFPGLPTEPRCMACGELLSIYQPDGNVPERLLGTCDSCGAWHLIDCDRAVTVLLPDADALHDADAGR